MKKDKRSKTPKAKSRNERTPQLIDPLKDLSIKIDDDPHKLSDDIIKLYQYAESEEKRVKVLKRKEIFKVLVECLMHELASIQKLSYKLLTNLSTSDQIFKTLPNPRNFVLFLGKRIYEEDPLLTGDIVNLLSSLCRRFVLKKVVIRHTHLPFLLVNLAEESLDETKLSVLYLLVNLCQDFEMKKLILDYHLLICLAYNLVSPDHAIRKTAASLFISALQFKPLREALSVDSIIMLSDKITKAIQMDDFYKDLRPAFLHLLQLLISNPLIAKNFVNSYAFDMLEEFVTDGNKTDKKSHEGEDGKLNDELGILVYDLDLKEQACLCYSALLRSYPDGFMKFADRDIDELLLKEFNSTLPPQTQSAILETLALMSNFIRTKDLIIKKDFLDDVLNLLPTQNLLIFQNVCLFASNFTCKYKEACLAFLEKNRMYKLLKLVCLTIPSYYFFNPLSPESFSLSSPNYNSSHLLVINEQTMVNILAWMINMSCEEETRSILVNSQIIPEDLAYQPSHLQNTQKVAQTDPKSQIKNLKVKNRKNKDKNNNNNNNEDEEGNEKNDDDDLEKNNFLIGFVINSLYQQFYLEPKLENKRLSDQFKNNEFMKKNSITNNNNNNYNNNNNNYYYNNDSDYKDMDDDNSNPYDENENKNINNDMISNNYNINSNNYNNTNQSINYNQATISNNITSGYNQQQNNDYLTSPILVSNFVLGSQSGHSLVDLNLLPFTKNKFPFLKSTKVISHCLLLLSLLAVDHYSRIECDTKKLMDVLVDKCLGSEEREVRNGACLLIFRLTKCPSIAEKLCQKGCLELLDRLQKRNENPKFAKVTFRHLLASQPTIKFAYYNCLDFEDKIKNGFYDCGPLKDEEMLKIGAEKWLLRHRAHHHPYSINPSLPVNVACQVPFYFFDRPIVLINSGLNKNQDDEEEEDGEAEEDVEENEGGKRPGFVTKGMVKSINKMNKNINNSKFWKCFILSGDDKDLPVDNILGQLISLVEDEVGPLPSTFLQIQKLAHIVCKKMGGRISKEHLNSLEWPDHFNSLMRKINEEKEKKDLEEREKEERERKEYLEILKNEIKRENEEEMLKNNEGNDEDSEQNKNFNANKNFPIPRLPLRKSLSRKESEKKEKEEEKNKFLGLKKMTNLLPIGLIQHSIQHHRAIMFKTLADRLDIPCTLVRRDYFRSFNTVKLMEKDFKTEFVEELKFVDYVVDLIHEPGRLIPLFKAKNYYTY